MDQKTDVVSALCEGMSIRAAGRLLGHHKDTVMRLGAKVGSGCTRIHGTFMRNLNVSRIEMDELWSYVGKKRAQVKIGDPDTVGDQYIFVAMDSSARAIISWLVGKRDRMHTRSFVEDIRYRVNGFPELTTDGFAAYNSAIAIAFKGQADYGVVDKQLVVVAGGPDTDNYYARQQLVAVKREVVSGSPQNISTSYVERQNLTMRMSTRRLARLSNGFSKKFDHHCAAVSLYATHYNFCRVHETLRTTPAMHLRVTDHVWTVQELVNAALTGTMPATVPRGTRPFRVIQGGKA